MCVNDCIVFWDSSHLPASCEYRHYHRTRCPVCGEPRYVTDPVDGTFKPRRVIFFFPIAPFVRSLFKRADLVRYLYWGREDSRPRGHASRSRGFQQKVEQNPIMNGDQRNLGLVGTTDGVPFFNDQKRGGWPFVQRVVNLPDKLSMHFANVHLHMLAPSEFWELDEDAGVLRRRVRAPASLQPHMHVIVDDLLRAYHEGIARAVISRDIT